MLQDFIIPVIDNKLKCNFIFVNMAHRMWRTINYNLSILFALGW